MTECVVCVWEKDRDRECVCVFVWERVWERERVILIVPISLSLSLSLSAAFRQLIAPHKKCCARHQNIVIPVSTGGSLYERACLDQHDEEVNKEKERLTSHFHLKDNDSQIGQDEQTNCDKERKKDDEQQQQQQQQQKPEVLLFFFCLSADTSSSSSS